MFVALGGVSGVSCLSNDLMDMGCREGMAGGMKYACVFGAVLDGFVGVLGVSDGVGTWGAGIFGGDERVKW